MDVEQTLRDYNIRFERKQDNKIRVLCSFHEDTKPSGTFLESGYYKCWSCNTSGNIYDYIAKKLGVTRKEAYSRINSGYNDSKDISIDSSSIEICHSHIWEDNNKKYRKELLDRQVTEELIRYYRIGFSGGRITIPIANKVGVYVNQRLYKPGAEDNKFLNSGKGNSGKKIRLFPIEQLDYDRILLVGGEIKAIAAASVLNEHGIGAISDTGGESSWQHELSSCFENKTVYVCLDIDETGERGAELRCCQLQNTSQWIGKIKLPLDIEKYPKGDINDFLREGGNLLELVEKCEKWVREDNKKLDQDEPCTSIDLDIAVGAEFAGKRIQFEALISSIDSRPYSIPKIINITCPRQSDFCSQCSVTSMPKDNQVYILQPERVEIMEMVGEERRHQKRILKEAIGIPQQCTLCEFEGTEYYNIEDTRISQKLDITSQKVERTMQIAYCIGDQGLELNDSYKMEGRMYPHPKNQQASLLISNYNQTEDALSTYKPQGMDRLVIFQPNEWTVEGIRYKLESIYEDFEANITFIYKRRPLHLAIDLCYHSPLFIPINNIPINGWSEVLIVGDSAQGKTKASSRLMQHYGLGERVICKGATTAGLLGGVAQQGNKRWFVTWGKIPTNDRRLVILEELKGATVEVIGSLTDMRSSGTAQITKIEARSAKARTRLIGISNPRGMNPISSYNFGVDVIKELIGNLEDIRRWDMCMLLERNEIDADEVIELEKHPPTSEHMYTSTLCRELILWAWTVENVSFENQGKLFDTANSLCKEFTDEIPIVDRFSMKEKLAKLSAALAARTFSYEENGLFIRDCHIEFIADFLRQVYNSEAFGYGRYTSIINQSEVLVSEKAIIQRIKDKTKFPQEFVSHSLTTELIDNSWIQDLLSLDQDTARALLGFLIRQRALKSTGKRGYYRKTSEYTKLLKKITQDGILDMNRPDYIKEEF